MRAMSISDHDHDNALAVSPAEAARRAGVGRTTLYAALKAGDLKSLKIGSRRLIMVDALRAWLASHQVGQARMDPTIPVIGERRPGLQAMIFSIRATPGSPSKCASQVSSVAACVRAVA